MSHNVTNNNAQSGMQTVATSIDGEHRLFISSIFTPRPNTSDEIQITPQSTQSVRTSPVMSSSPTSWCVGANKRFTRQRVLLLLFFPRKKGSIPHRSPKTSNGSAESRAPGSYYCRYPGGHERYLRSQAWLRWGGHTRTPNITHKLPTSCSVFAPGMFYISLAY